MNDCKHEAAYVVTDGDYSDYGIEAVFLDKSAAENFTKIFGGRIEEWPVHAAVKISRPLWRVEFSPDGSILHGFSGMVKPSEEPYEERVERDGGLSSRYYNVYVFADDKEYAEKKAIDLRTKWLAEQKGV